MTHTSWEVFKDGRRSTSVRMTTTDKGNKMLTRTEIKNYAKQAVANQGPYITHDSGAENYFRSIGQWDKFSILEQMEITMEANKQADRVIDFLGL